MSAACSIARLLLAIFIIACCSFGSGMVLAQGSPPRGTDEEISFWAELAFWESVKDSHDMQQLQAYVSAYPDGRFTSLARLRIEALQKATEQGRQPDPSEAGLGDATSPNGVGEPSKAPGETFRDCEVCPRMVVVPAGSFEMGSNQNRPEEQPPHEVQISRPFAIGIHEISVDEWDACLREGSCRAHPEQGSGGGLPMANLSWNDTRDYLNWLSAKSGQEYRLPSEAEWEYATRAGTLTSYWWGNAPAANRANCSDCDPSQPSQGASPGGTYAANPFGLYDVHGNVWEWTQDCWNPNYRGAPADGSPWLRGDCLSRVLRGGSWALEHDYMRASRRGRYDRDVRYYLNGFRVVREVPVSVATSPEAELPEFATAVSDAANRVFSAAAQSTPAGQSFVVDPLIDGLSGFESAATRRMEEIITSRVRSSFPGFTVKSFSQPNASRSRLVSIGTFTGVNKQRKTRGQREAFRICLVLLDLEAGKVLSKAKLFSRSEGVDITPTAFYRDNPVWIADPATQAYIKTCQATQPGDSIDPLYGKHVRTAALLNEAIDAYETGQYENSRNLFRLASQSPGGDQLRTQVGLYLTNWRLGSQEQTANAVSRIVKTGMDSKKIGIILPFGPGSTRLREDEPQHREVSNLWLTQIAKEAVERGSCLEIIGHTHALGPEMLNQRLAIRRAEFVKQQMQSAEPRLANRMLAVGRGTDDNLIGSRTGDVKDALDRRVEFSVIPCDPAE